MRAKHECDPYGPTRVHRWHGSVGVRKRAKQLGICGRVLGDLIDKAEIGNEARGSQGIGPVGDERADSDDDESPPRTAVVGGSLAPKDNQGETGHC